MARRILLVKPVMQPGGKMHSLKLYDGDTGDFMSNGPITSVACGVEIEIMQPVRRLIVQPDGTITLVLADIITKLG